MDTLRLVWPFARVYWRRYLLGLVLVPVSALATLGIPRVTGECVRALEELAASGATAARTAEAWGRLWRPPLAREGLAWLPDAGLLPDLLGLAILSGISLLGIRWFIISASRRVEFDLRNHLFAQLLYLDRSFYHGAKTGDLMSRVTADVERTRLLVGPIILYASRTGFLLAFGIPLMVAVNLRLTLLVMLPLSLMTVAVRIIGPRVHRETMRAQEIQGELSALGQEAFSGVRVLKAFAQEPAERQRFASHALAYCRQNLRLVRVSAWMHPLIGGISDLALISLLIVGGERYLAGAIDHGDFVTFCGYQVALIWPMLSIGWVVNQYQRARASVDRLREFLDARPRVEAPREGRRPPAGALEGHVSIRGLTFAYPGSAPVLENVSIEVPAGTTVAILGRTGAGKSTLMQLIPRILPAPPGTIFIDGIDLNDFDLGFLRRSIGYVPQESFLFSRTVAENIAFGLEESDRPLVERAAAVARFDKDIDQFARGYDEMVGERGVTLSGGQKQRASLARALAISPRILLLDDAMSAVDSETEAEILRELPRATEGLTSIIVSHRVASIAHAHRIYVLEAGRVAEEGSHAELLARGGIYAEVHRLQKLAGELEDL